MLLFAANHIGPVEQLPEACIRGVPAAQWIPQLPQGPLHEAAVRNHAGGTCCQ